MAACTLSRRYYLMQLQLHILSWWGAKQHHFSPAPSPLSQSSVTDWVKSWYYKIPSETWRQQSSNLVTHLTNLWAQPLRGSRDKSHGELDTETQILIDHGGCAFPKRFIKHCCLHLTHDSSLTKQMPPLSILFLWSLQSNRLLCWHIPPPTEIFVMWGCSALHHMKGKTYSELIKVYI